MFRYFEFARFRDGDIPGNPGPPHTHTHTHTRPTGFDISRFRDIATSRVRDRATSGFRRSDVSVICAPGLRCFDISRPLRLHLVSNPGFRDFAIPGFRNSITGPGLLDFDVSMYRYSEISISRAPMRRRDFACPMPRRFDISRTRFPAVARFRDFWISRFLRS